MKKIISLIILGTLFLALPASPISAGETPSSVVESAVNRVLNILQDQTRGTDAKRVALREIALDFFDFEALSRRTLGMSWKKLDRDEQKEFVKLYSDLLEHTYTEKIEDYSHEKVVITGERALNESKAEVETEVISGTKAIPINYRMFLMNGLWRVYDVYVEGVSLVKNYRSQFNSILDKSTPREMLDQLRTKVESFETSK